jgi:hypothetical protein
MSYSFINYVCVPVKWYFGLAEQKKSEGIEIPFIIQTGESSSWHGDVNLSESEDELA